LHHILPQLRIDGEWPEVYAEPFVGGGAVFFALRAAGFTGQVVLNDVQKVVVETLRAIRDEAEAVIEGASTLAATGATSADERAFYYQVRAAMPNGGVELASWWLYVNRAGFNGLLRFNKSGGFNVPYGDGKPVNIDADVIRAASTALRGAAIYNRDFKDLAVDRGTRRRVAIYCDPPYLPASKTANFTAYSAGGFGAGDQLKLAAWARQQADAGAKVVLSNAGTEDALMAFSTSADEIIPLKAPRSISCKSGKRLDVGEYLFIYHARQP